MASPGEHEYVYMAIVPGIGSLPSIWLPTLPHFVKMIPVDYQPSEADMNASASLDERWKAGRQPGGPGDYIDVMALRLLSASLPYALAQQSWAIAGHSSGGTVVYRCMEHISNLLERPQVAAREIGNSALQWLSAVEADKILDLLKSLGGNAPKMPLAAISMEGSLLPCDVEGWASDLADPMSTVAHQLSGWEMTKQCTLAADLQERCGDELPPRHLQSIRQWLELKNGPPFAYMAGTLSSKRTDYVFPTLRAILNASGAPASRLEIQMVRDSGHEMYTDNPEAVKRGFDRILSVSMFDTRGYQSFQGQWQKAFLGVVGAVVVFAFLCLSLMATIRLRTDSSGRSRRRPLLQT